MNRWQHLRDEELRLLWLSLLELHRNESRLSSQLLALGREHQSQWHDEQSDQAHELSQELENELENRGFWL